MAEIDRRNRARDTQTSSNHDARFGPDPTGVPAQRTMPLPPLCVRPKHRRAWPPKRGLRTGLAGDLPPPARSQSATPGRSERLRRCCSSLPFRILAFRAAGRSASPIAFRARRVPRPLPHADRRLGDRPAALYTGRAPLYSHLRRQSRRKTSSRSGRHQSRRAGDPGFRATKPWTTGRAQRRGSAGSNRPVRPAGLQPVRHAAFPVDGLPSAPCREALTGRLRSWRFLVTADDPPVIRLSGERAAPAAGSAGADLRDFR